MTAYKSFIVRNEGLTLLPKHIHAKEERNGLPSANKSFSTEAAMLFASFGCTHPPPSVLPFLFLLVQKSVYFN